MVLYTANKDNSFTVDYRTVTYVIDQEQLVIILNLNKQLIVDDTNEYPYYNKNNKKHDLIEILFNTKKGNLVSIFKNNNCCDLRRDNVTFYHEYHRKITDTWDVKDYIQGHYNTAGKDAFTIKNPIWITSDDEYLMFCDPNNVCKLCKGAYDLIKQYEETNKHKITFYCTSEGYIGSSSKLYIHQIIMDYYRKGKGTKHGSVDHINRDKCDNRLCNLRIASHENQQLNKIGRIPGTKRVRNKNAKPLPEGLTQDMMPKYVGYYTDCYDKEKGQHREFFKLVGHPKIDKPIYSSKSAKFTMLQKLEEIKTKLYNIENNFVEENPNGLPQYYRIHQFRDAPHISYEKRTDGKRYGLTMKLKEGVEIGRELERFNEKLHSKYPDLSASVDN